MTIVDPPSSRNNQTTGPDEQPKLIVIAGPTAVGKTFAGIELALRFDGEVINADSRYLYRGLDIGVAKPNALKRRGLPHHVIDVVDPSDEMSLATYQQLAYGAINQTVARGHLPFLVGGTPLYINAVVEGWRIPQVAPDWPFRRQLEAEAAESGIESLSARLRQVDPVAADRCGANLRRIIRALEIFKVTGKPMSEVEGAGPRPYDTLEFWLTMPRDQLHQAVDNRVDDQIENGLVAEVRALLESGLDPAAPAMSSLGYRQLVPYIEGKQTLAEAVRQIKIDTHRYVRQQETWLRRNHRLRKIDVAKPHWIESMAAAVASFSGRVDAKKASTRVGNRDSAAER